MELPRRKILRSEVPLLRDRGVAAEWQLITGDDAFFSVTKAIHNALQGAKRPLSPLEQATYLANATRNGHLLDETYDLIVAP
jgi:trehalose synthase